MIFSPKVNALRNPPKRGNILHGDEVTVRYGGGVVPSVSLRGCDAIRVAAVRAVQACPEPCRRVRFSERMKVWNFQAVCPNFGNWNESRVY